jgi:hypothetical protein
LYHSAPAPSTSQGIHRLTVNSRPCTTLASASYAFA